jgi:hypothetical protein
MKLRRPVEAEVGKYQRIFQLSQPFQAVKKRGRVDCAFPHCPEEGMREVTSWFTRPTNSKDSGPLRHDYVLIVDVTAIYQHIWPCP